jgi:hypothetical protein
VSLIKVGGGGADPRLLAMKEKLASEEGRAIYARRATSVEPAFGIIKRVLGFRQFMLRGHQKVNGRSPERWRSGG